jgi:hypothetical protein
MSRKLIDLTGLRFGRLIVVKRLGIGSQFYQPKWECKCDCGAICHTRSGELRYGQAKSCGCYNLEVHTKHGHTTHTSKSKTYSTWISMHQRCENPDSSNYRNYGGRGIFVCKRWGKFENFLTDMGESPSGLSIERIDNNGPYAPWNCCWADVETQNKNKRDKKMPPRRNNLPRGVNFHGKRFTAEVTIKKKRYYLGVFDTANKAGRAVYMKLRAAGIEPR